MSIGKTLLQFAVLVALFFGLWFLLRQVDWLRVTHWQQHADATEQKLGDMVWNAYKNSEHELNDEKAMKLVTDITNRICRANNLDSSKIHLHLLQKDEINAFTLPNGHIVVFSGLIAACSSEEELSAVVAHEIAHDERHHVMKKIVTEAGITTISAVIGGKGGGAGIRKITQMISSTAYDRNLEKEADLTAVDYLTNAGISSEPFADFLYRFAEGRDSSAGYSDWISTHPDPKVRAHYVLDYFKKKKKTFPKIEHPEWAEVHDNIRSLEKKKEQASANYDEESKN